MSLILCPLSDYRIEFARPKQPQKGPNKTNLLWVDNFITSSNFLYLRTSFLSIWSLPFINIAATVTEIERSLYNLLGLGDALGWVCCIVNFLRIVTVTCRKVKVKWHFTTDWSCSKIRLALTPILFPEELIWLVNWQIEWTGGASNTLPVQVSGLSFLGVS